VIEFETAINEQGMGDGGWGIGDRGHMSAIFNPQSAI